MYHINLWFIGLLAFSLAACTKTVLVPTPITEPDPVEDPVFSTLDFATPQQDEGRGLVVDGSNLYVVGFSKGSLDGTNQGNADGILRRYNGGKLWGVQFGTRSFDQPDKVAMDSNGSVYVVGQTAGPLGFQVKGLDVFLAKFNQDGERVWIRQFGTKNTDRPAGLAIDSNDRIYVLSDEGTNNFVIRKFSIGGSLLKTKSVTLNNRPGLEPKAIAVDSLNNLTVLTDWNNSGNSLGRDVRLFKYNSKLSEIWQKNYGIFINEYAYDVTTDSNNNIYFTINIFSTSDGGYFIKKSANGNTIYERRLEYDINSKDTFPKSITVDTNDNIYIAGQTGGSFPGFSNAGMNGISDIVVFKYNSSGTEQWITQFDDGNYGTAAQEEAVDIAVNGTVYITGRTGGNLITGSDTSYGGWDAYVAQLNRSNGTILGVDQ